MADYAGNPGVLARRMARPLQRQERMGVPMTPHEFIEKNVHDELRKQGFKAGVCFSVSRDAVDYYRQRSMFSKSVVLDVLAWSKKRAKELSR